MPGPVRGRISCCCPQTISRLDASVNFYFRSNSFARDAQEKAQRRLEETRDKVREELKRADQQTREDLDKARDQVRHALSQSERDVEKARDRLRNRTRDDNEGH